MYRVSTRAVGMVEKSKMLAGLVRMSINILEVFLYACTKILNFSMFLIFYCLSIKIKEIQCKQSNKLKKAKLILVEDWWSN